MLATKKQNEHWWEESSEIHKAGEEKFGRDWFKNGCTCGACRVARRIEEACRELPDCCNFDPLDTRTVQDCVWLATIELDLHEEGQDGCCTKREAAKLRKYLKKWSKVKP